MVGKVERDSMNILKNKWVVSVMLLLACSGDPVDDPIPVVSFTDIAINLSLPEYLTLQQDKGYKMLSNGGVRGIIVYRQSATTYLAYERNCSFQPNEACATVDVHSSGLFMNDPCCSSSFDFSTGDPTGGPAWRPLRRYRTQFQNNTLTISDEIIN